MPYNERDLSESSVSQAILTVVYCIGLEMKWTCGIFLHFKMRYLNSTHLPLCYTCTHTPKRRILWWFLRVREWKKKLTHNSPTERNLLYRFKEKERENNHIAYRIENTEHTPFVWIYVVSIGYGYGFEPTVLCHVLEVTLFRYASIFYAWN